MIFVISKYHEHQAGWELVVLLLTVVVLSGTLAEPYRENIVYLIRF